MENRVVFIWAPENERHMVEKIEKDVSSVRSIVWSFSLN